MSRQIVYVFNCSNPDVIGLSLLEDGSNLPPLAACPGPWVHLKSVPMTEEGLRNVTLDLKLSMINLKTRDYHTARTSAVVLDFPKRTGVPDERGRNRPH